MLNVCMKVSARIFNFLIHVTLVKIDSDLHVRSTFNFFLVRYFILLNKKVAVAHNKPASCCWCTSELERSLAGSPW
jgi:hypothetical protein